MSVKTIKKITFNHPYFKFLNAEFTTIRGKTKMKKFKDGEEIVVTYKDGHRIYYIDATVVKRELVKLKDLSLEFLQEDANCPKHKIDTRQDFIDLLNSFYPRNRFPHLKVTEDTELTVLTIKKRHD